MYEVLLDMRPTTIRYVVFFGLLAVPVIRDVLSFWEFEIVKFKYLRHVPESDCPQQPLRAWMRWTVLLTPVAFVLTYLIALRSVYVQIAV